MSVAFRKVVCGRLRDLEAAAPDGAVIGIVGDDRSGRRQLLRLAAGLDQPERGEVEVSGARRYIGPRDPLHFEDAGLVVVEHAFAFQDAFTRELAFSAMHGARRSGATILLLSNEEDLLRRASDEIWWMREGRLVQRGDPEETLACYRRYVMGRVRAAGERDQQELAPRMRSGDGRAQVLSIETIGENGRPTMTWRSGEAALVKVRIRFRENVADPVFGIMIRTRVGLNVYGTNTGLEGVECGPCAAGETVELTCAFRCELCPEEYTLTVASHDPDGVWHDWLEDAVAFTVTDSRYTAGVANLRAKMTARRV